ncbi:helix-turn-helix transcriptional regulator [Brevibacillus ruminantium]|uniref:Helix-turn-helix transcriptional regulator n=1 Tax=Brevibacillus ruminantium TaxID=2950604 RepID=A0ABY4WC99_9BACL|nr:helix-turn-helix transcriptional regulator [Brevibacillus ruminantium]USG64364.1 helix-turn-helix transcriptional regulator [Brevibacillus ruminantium]
MRVYLPLQPPALQNETSDSHYRYREFLPSNELESYVACYWTLDANVSERNHLHRIIPDGCVDIIFDLNASSSTNAAFAVGLMTTYETINLTVNQSLFGIRFFSDTARRLIRYPVSELMSYHVFLEEIWGSEGKFIAEEVTSANNRSEMIERVETLLIRLLLQNESNSDQLLQSSMKYMYASQGTISVRMLSEKLGYSERKVRRTFQKELGISPKELLDILRFQYMLREMKKGVPSRLTDLALNYGFYDQPHFNRNFKRFYGLTPGQVFT